MGEARELIGQVLHDTYRIERLLAEGGMGVVYEASHLRLPRRFAIKLLHGEIARHPDALARFQREAKIASGLGHPHILDVIDFYSTDDGAPYIVMELLDGEDLADRLKRLGRLPLHQAASIFRQAASALQAAHENGIVHRDLKPQNLFLCRRGERDDFVKVLDFGISKILGSGTVMTEPVSAMGTPGYMAPEQAEQRAAEADARTDVFAMGTILYEMIAGRRPFEADSVPALLYTIVHKEAPSLRSLVSDVPAGVEQVVARALHKQPEGRFGSIEAFWRAFARAIEGEGIELSEPTEDRGTDWTGRGATRPDGGEPALAETLVEAPADDTVREPTSARVSGTTLSSGAGERVPLPTDAGRGSPYRRWLLPAAAVLVIGGLLAVALHLGIRRTGAPLTATPTGADAPIRFGIVPYLPPEQLRREYRSLLAYLTKYLGRPVTLELVHDNEALATKLASGQLELAAFSAYWYVQVKRANPETRLLATHHTSSGSTYSGFIVARKGAGIADLADLRDKVFCYVSRTSSSGYFFPRAVFRERGLDPDALFKRTRFAGSHLSNLKALASGACDGAAVFADLFHERARHGLAPGSFVVLASTEAIPFDAYVAPARLPADLVSALREALLSLRPGSATARRVLGKTSRIHGFARVNDHAYDRVRQLGRYLEPGTAKGGKRRATAPGRLVVLQSSHVHSLDPPGVATYEDLGVVTQTHEPLVGYDEMTGEPTPKLAVSWQRRDETFVFKLRQGVSFHDGTRLTAAAVVQSLERSLRSPTGKAYLWDVSEIKATGPMEVTIRLARPGASFLMRLAVYAFAIGRPGEPFPAGTGPYRVQAWNKQIGSVVLVPFRGYWGNAPRLESVVFRAEPDPEVRASFLVQGDAHLVLQLPAQLAAELGKREDLEVLRSAQTMTLYLTFNTQKRYLRDPGVRKALSMAVDRDQFVAELFKGSATRAGGSLPPRLDRIRHKSKAVVFDPARARGALARAGLASRTLKLYLFAEGRSYLPEPRLAARILVRGFLAAGVRVKPVFVLYEDLKRACAAGEHDMVLQGWTPDYPDPENVYWLLSSRSLDRRFNLAQFKDRELEDLLEKARAEQHLGRRQALFSQLESIVENRRPWLPLAYVAGHVVTRSELKDVHCSFSYSGHVDLRDAYFKPKGKTE